MDMLEKVLKETGESLGDALFFGKECAEPVDQKAGSSNASNASNADPEESFRSRRPRLLHDPPAALRLRTTHQRGKRLLLSCAFMLFHPATLFRSQQCSHVCSVQLGSSRTATSARTCERA